MNSIPRTIPVGLALALGFAGCARSAGDSEVSRGTDAPSNDAGPGLESKAAPGSGSMLDTGTAPLASTTSAVPLPTAPPTPTDASAAPTPTPSAEEVGNSDGAGGAAGGVTDDGGGDVNVADSGAAGSGGTGGAIPSGGADAGPSVDVAGFDDFVLRSDDMHDYEGLTLSAYFDHNVDAESLSDVRSTVVEAGAFELRWPQRFDRNTFGAYCFLFVDLDADGACGAADPAWRFFVNNEGGFQDGAPQVYQFIPTGNSQRVLVDNISCDDFDAGLR